MGFINSGGGGGIVATDGKTYAPVMQRSIPLTIKGVEVATTGAVNAMKIYNGSIYYAVGNFVYRATVDNPYEIVATSPNYGGTILSIAVDSTGVYYGGATQTVIKANLSTLATIATSPNYGAIVCAIAVDSTGVYYGGATTKTVIKANLTTLTTLATSPGYGGQINAISTDGVNVYYGGETTQTVIRANISTLATLATSPSYGGTINAIAVDGTGVYYGGATTNLVRKADLITLATIVNSPTSAYVVDVALDSNWIYYSGSGAAFKRANKSTLLTVSTIASVSDTNRIALNDFAVYLGTSGSKIISYLTEEISQILGYKEVV